MYLQTFTCILSKNVVAFHESLIIYVASARLFLMSHKNKLFFEEPKPIVARGNTFSRARYFLFTYFFTIEILISIIVVFWTCYLINVIMFLNAKQHLLSVAKETLCSQINYVVSVRSCSNLDIVLKFFFVKYY